MSVPASPAASNTSGVNGVSPASGGSSIFIGSKSATSVNGSSKENIHGDAPKWTNKVYKRKRIPDNFNTWKEEDKKSFNQASVFMKYVKLANEQCKVLWDNMNPLIRLKFSMMNQVNEIHPGEFDDYIASINKIREYAFADNLDPVAKKSRE